MGDGSFAITLHELASIMTSCPKLQHLALGQLIFTEDASEQPKPVLLGELRELRVADLQTYEGRADIFKAVLDLINPGQNALSVEMSLLWVTGSSQRALDAVCSFVERSNVSKLHVRGGPVSGGWEDNPYFASQFGPLPRVRTLILEEFCFCDVVRVESHMSNFDDDDWINTYHNPRPINSELVPWPDVRNLYLRRCIIEKEYLYHLLLPRTVHTLYLRECSNNLKAGQDPDSDLGASFKSQRSMEDCVQLLSQAGLKVVDSPTWDVSWPSFIL
ncbi:hypothetical protein FRC09_008531 [Ceratobasidium sp. 395]|nr:hypothetical protein FRC09_008531 [Ceratobasidium sp. 395]